MEHDEAGLVTGAVGQIGSELTLALRERYGGEAVVASDVRMPTDVPLRDGGPFEFVDCMDPHHLTRVMQITTSTPSTTWLPFSPPRARQRPLQAWQLNVNGLVTCGAACARCPVRMADWSWKEQRALDCRAASST